MQIWGAAQGAVLGLEGLKPLNPSAKVEASDEGCVSYPFLLQFFVFLKVHHRSLLKIELRRNV